MPTMITHAITAIPISMALKNKVNYKRLLLFSLIFSVLPDFDVIGYRLGIEYNSLFGHRGFSHSLFFIAIAAVFFAYLAAPKINFKSKIFFLVYANFFAIGCLHILLDSMTNGGLGVALFSPFSNERFFFPWRPIEVSALLPEYFFQLNGWRVIKFEALYLILPSVVISFLIYLKKRK